MANEAVHNDWWRHFEVVSGLPLLLALALHFVVPWSLPRGQLTPVLVPAGVVLLLVGACLVAGGRRELRRHGQPTDPGRPTRKIVTTGVFSYSRNPLYLGGTAMLLGLTMVLGLPWLIASLLPAIGGCHFLLIVPEERYLADRFGDEYRSYRESVGRWIGRKSSGS